MPLIPLNYCGSEVLSGKWLVFPHACGLGVQGGRPQGITPKIGNGACRNRKSSGESFWLCVATYPFADSATRPTRLIPVAEPSRRSLKAFGPRVDGHSTAPAGLRANRNDEFSHLADNAAYICPKCGAQDLTRIPRRLIDRFLALFADVRRFRCTHVECMWEGNLRRKKSSSRRFEP